MCHGVMTPFFISLSLHIVRFLYFYGRPTSSLFAPQSVMARSLPCYWGTRELGMTTVELAKRLNIAQPSVSQAVIRTENRRRAGIKSALEKKTISGFWDDGSYGYNGGY